MPPDCTAEVHTEEDLNLQENDFHDPRPSRWNGTPKTNDASQTRSVEKLMPFNSSAFNNKNDQFSDPQLCIANNEEGKYNMDAKEHVLLGFTDRGLRNVKWTYWTKLVVGYLAGLASAFLLNKIWDLTGRCCGDRNL